MSTTANLIEQLFEHDILITPEQAKLLTERDVTILTDLVKFPREAESYLRQLETRAAKQAAASQAAAVAASKEVKGTNIERAAAQHSASMQPSVEIIRTYTRKPHKRSYNDFVQHFTVRFQKVSAILRGRKELASVLPVEKLKKQGGANEAVSVIGLVVERRETKNEHLIIQLEDRTGVINVLFAKGKPDLHTLAQDLHVDDVVGITGKLGEDIIFADGLYFPDVPLQHELKKSPDEAYAVCVSDIHFGNKNFMSEEFQQFLAWLRGDAGTPEARRIAAKTHYVIIPGDVIEGVGIYPSQENDLSIPDIYDQYRFCDEVLSQIPEDKHLIIIPGNHDIGRLSEPQPRLPKDVMPRLNARERTYFTSNPSTVRIHAKPGFPGFNVLLYHGGSFIHYGNDVSRLFKEGGVNNPCSIMQYILQRRHLAPAHASSLYVPDTEEDQLVIDEVPDFLITGHLHMAQERTWRGITMLSCSCWVPITDYQQKQGLKCDPGKLVLINLQTRAVNLLTPADLISEDA